MATIFATTENLDADLSFRRCLISLGLSSHLVDFKKRDGRAITVTVGPLLEDGPFFGKVLEHLGGLAGTWDVRVERA